MMAMYSCTVTNVFFSPPGVQEELRHFETKVEKHSHYQEQLELSHQKLLHVEALGDLQHIQKNKDKYNTLSEKTREMGYKVRGDGGGHRRCLPGNGRLWLCRIQGRYLEA